LAKKGDGRHERDGDQRAGEKEGGEAPELTPPARALAFRDQPEVEALAKHPELMGAFRELAASRARAATDSPDNPAAQALYVAQVRADIQRRLNDGRIPPLPAVNPSPQERPRER
jgi:hypothetical protein